MKILSKKLIQCNQEVYCIEVNNKNHNFLLEHKLIVANCGPSCHDSSASAGSPNVFVNSKPLCRVGDPVACGSAMATGSGNVITN